MTLFDAEADGPRATKVTVPASELSVPTGAYIKVADAVLEPGRAHGAIANGSPEAGWDLSFESEARGLSPPALLVALPHATAEDQASLPYPDARFSGTVTVDDERISIDAWPGMIGHNWGAEHAERWVWIQGNELQGGEGYFDAAFGRIKVGPLTTPWVGNAILRLDGSEHRLGGLDRVRSTKVDEAPTACEFRLTGEDVSVRGRVSSEPRNFVAWVYADPVGPEHNTLNCSISDLELTIDVAGSPPRRVESVGAAAYELGMRETDHGIPVQPYPDGLASSREPRPGGAQAEARAQRVAADLGAALTSRPLAPARFAATCPSSGSGSPPARPRTGPRAATPSPSRSRWPSTCGSARCRRSDP